MMIGKLKKGCSPSQKNDFRKGSTMIIYLANLELVLHPFLYVHFPLSQKTGFFLLLVHSKKISKIDTEHFFLHLRSKSPKRGSLAQFELGSLSGVT